MEMNKKQHVRDEFLKYGYALFEEYSHCMKKMKYRCPNGHENSMNWNSFDRGRRCPDCSKYRHRYTTESISKMFSEQGCELLEEYNKQHKTPLNYKCKCGKIGTKHLSLFLRGGYYCYQCGIKAKQSKIFKNSIKYQAVFDYLKENNCILLSPNINQKFGTNNVKFKYTCKCGREAESTWGNFKKGKRCGYCSENGRCKKFTIEEVRNTIELAGFSLLSKQYINAATPLEIKCDNGHKLKMRLNNFKNGARCMFCSLERRRGPGHHAWRGDRDALKQDKKFRAKCHGILDPTFKAIGGVKHNHSHELLGYTPKQLQEHITSHPNWTDLKDTNWHLDHIMPIKAFIDYDIKDIKLINCLDNLQPLTQRENNQKYASYNPQEFEAWLSARSVTFSRPKTPVEELDNSSELS